MGALAEPFRIGVLADASTLPAWLHTSVSKVRAVARASLTHVFLDRDARRGRTLLRLPFDLYERLDRRVFASSADPLAPRDAASLFAGAEVVDLPAAAGTRLAEALARARLDVLLHLGSRLLTGAALLAPRLGVWTWSALEEERRGGVPFLAAVARAVPACETQLLVLRPEGEAPRVLERSWSCSDPNGLVGCEPLSLQRARQSACWKDADLAARALRRFAQGGGKQLVDLPEQEAVARPEAPGPLRTAALAARVTARFLRRRRTYGRFEGRWHLAVRARRPGLPDRAGEGFRRLPMPADRFFADPFLVTRGGRSFLFYEDADRASEIGRLACAELDAAGQPVRTATVLEASHHLSYPCVFAFGGELWMVPESSAARTVELYRARDFPWHWAHERTLFRDVRAVDATIHVDGGRLWMFVAMAPEAASGCNDELFVFHARDPRGPWTPHPRNPVVSDVRCARPAGRLFEHGGALYRPGQDCSETYGGAIVLQRVEALSELEYRESPAGRIAPALPGRIGAHTFARSDTLEVIDLRILEPRPGVGRAGRAHSGLLAGRRKEAVSSAPTRAGV